jgi:hypothetical protein
MGVIASESMLVVREMFLEAAITFAAEVYAQGLARALKPEDLRAHIKSLMFEPSYQSYV